MAPSALAAHAVGELELHPAGREPSDGEFLQRRLRRPREPLSQQIRLTCHGPAGEPFALCDRVDDARFGELGRVAKHRPEIGICIAEADQGNPGLPVALIGLRPELVERPPDGGAPLGLRLVVQGWLVGGGMGRRGSDNVMLLRVGTMSCGALPADKPLRFLVFAATITSPFAAVMLIDAEFGQRRRGEVLAVLAQLHKCGAGFHDSLPKLQFSTAMGCPLCSQGRIPPGNSLGCLSGADILLEDFAGDASGTIKVESISSPFPAHGSLVQQVGNLPRC